MRDHLNVCEFKIAEGVIQHNNVILSALVDDDLSVRKLALQKVIEAQPNYSSASHEIIIF